MSDAQHDPQGPPRAGERLKAARERASMSLTQVADQLRLSANVIEALEQGQYGIIGAQVFVRGYIKRYAELVGEDPALADSAAQQHAWRDPSVELTSTRLRPLDGMGDRMHIGRWPLVVAVVLLCLWGIYWWAQRAAAPRAAGAATDVVQEQVVTPPALGTGQVAEVPVVHGEAKMPAGSNAGIAASVATGPAAANPTAVAAPILPAAVPQRAVAAAAAAPVAAAPKPAGTAGDVRRHVRLNFHGESWTELYDAGGARLYWGLGEPGDLQSISGTPPFKLILGNPAAVSVSFEGASLVLPAPRGSTTLRVGIDAKGSLEPLR